jgi:NAD(P)-dependent dehydrogenase (short-subunit alcohol dehydrogenase family)
MLDESARLYGLDSAEAFAAQQPLERLLDHGEVAAMIAWLAGPAGSGVTGAALAVDAGRQCDRAAARVQTRGEDQADRSQLAGPFAPLDRHDSHFNRRAAVSIQPAPTGAVREL